MIHEEEMERACRRVVIARGYYERGDLVGAIQWFFDKRAEKKLARIKDENVRAMARRIMTYEIHMFLLDVFRPGWDSPRH